MSIIYRCRHCGKTIGKLSQSIVDTEQLGWHQLNEQEQKEMIDYHDNGDIQIKTICENCQDALERNPSYHELDFFIQ